MENLEKITSFENDIESINQIPAIANILEVICSSTGMGYAAVARVTKDRWVACAVNDKINFGLGIGGELPVETTLCQKVFDLRETVAIDNVDQDPIYSNHHTPKIYGLQSYISIPIVLRNGTFFGTLCAIDPHPALVNNAKIIKMFKLFSELISYNLDSLKDLSDTKTKLFEEKKNAKVRDQFIAILGHDLRNPINAISNGVQLMLRSELDDRNTRLAKVIQDSTNRTKGLIDNILDFASSHLGEGIKLNFENSTDLEEVLGQIITEIRIAYPDRQIISDFNLTSDIKADHRRVAQLFSNLLGNAVTHGERQSPIIVTATTDTNGLELCVANKGEKIPPETEKHLFKPFSRGKIHQGQEGLGLGLYISHQIALAHKGQILVRSTAEETCFTLQIPS
ncbi:Bacteriophytochrome [compost metagenome]